MNWTRTDAIRRALVVTGLIAGPVLLVLSIVINYTPPSGSMRADFDTMAAHAGLIVAECFLETFGFMMVLGAFAGATQALRRRGGALGTAGAVLALLGIIGFAMSNASGFTLAQLTQLPDRDAAFVTAGALLSGEISSLVGTIGMVLELLGQVGGLLIIGGLMRARLVPLWPLLIIIVGSITNIVIGTMLGTLISDVLLLIACAWVAMRIARCSHKAWLGEVATSVPQLARVTT